MANLTKFLFFVSLFIFNDFILFSLDYRECMIIISWFMRLLVKMFYPFSFIRAPHIFAHIWCWCYPLQFPPPWTFTQTIQRRVEVQRGGFFDCQSIEIRSRTSGGFPLPRQHSTVLLHFSVVFVIQSLAFCVRKSFVQFTPALIIIRNLLF